MSERFEDSPNMKIGLKKLAGEMKNAQIITING